MKLILRLTFLLLVSFQFNPKTSAQNAVYVGIPTTKFNFYTAAQNNSNWCWAACLQMIFNYYGVNISQEQIVARTYGVDPNGQLPNWTGSLPVITANLNNWNIDNSGRMYAVAASLNWGAPTPVFLIQELLAQRPVMIGYQSGPNAGHAVVITACSYIQTNAGPIIQTIVVRDPWPSEANIATSGRVEYPGVNLANLIQAHWYIRVQ
jgi:hypothetical protein